MGVVYRAHDPIINRLVALKTITNAVAADQSLLERFYREAQSAGGLQHPNIVTIYDMGDEKGIPYIAMELIEGSSFEQLIAEPASDPISLKLVYAVQACRAFDYAHKRGIVHRDIKPGNIMVTKEGTVKVVDFGIARVLETSKTQTGMLIGTFAYMSPEQYHGEHADERSDIWAFGVLLFELLCYQRPFAGETPVSLMHGICSQEPAALRKFLPDYPNELEDIVSKTLRKSPAQRYQSMEELLLDLEPLCKRLQVQSVNELVVQGRRLVEQNQLPEARDVIRLALRIDSNNQHVRSMLEKVNAEMKRIHVRPKAQELVERGRALAEEGKLQDARVAAANALQLDSGFEPAQELQRMVRKELDRVQLVAGWLEAAKQHLAEGSPEEAEPVLAQVLQAEPSNRQAAGLQQQARKEKLERQKRLRLLEQLRHARRLWTQQDYGPCIRLLTDLAKEFPGEEEISRLLEIVRGDQLEQRRQILQDCRNFVDAARYEECFALLTKLKEQFPEDNEITGLLENARKGQRGHRRRQDLMEAKELLVTGRYGEGISLLTVLDREFPNEPDIIDLLENTRQKQREQRRQEGLTKASDFLGSRRYGECAALLVSLKKEFPGDDQIAKLIAALKYDQAEQRKKEGLVQGRSFLASRRYEECIALAGELQKDFPQEPEFKKLAETARGDRAEQEKQQKLGEARAYLAAQSFTEAMSLLDELVAAHPQDPAVLRMRAVAKREQEKHSRAERILDELDGLKRLLSEKRYSEVISRAKQLLTEFPGETNFKRLAEFAANQQQSIEKDLPLRRTLEEVKALFAANRFKDAIVAVQTGLKSFPGDIELLDLCHQAEIQQRKLEIRQQIEGRVREIKVKINREKFSEAIDLAQKTLMTFGPDTDVSQLLTSAEVELESRERKKGQLGIIEGIRTQMDSGELEAGNQAINEALKARTFEPFDPRIQRLIKQIEDAKTMRVEQAAGWSTVPPTIFREYALPQGAPPPSTAPSPEKTFLKHISSGQGAAAQPALSPKSAPPMIPSQGSMPLHATVQPQQPADLKSPEPTGLVEQIRPSSLPAEWSSTTQLEYTASAPGGRARPALIAALIVASLVAAWASLHWFLPRTVQPRTDTNQAPEPPKVNIDELQAQESEALSIAGKRIAADDLVGARRTLEQAASLKGPLVSEIGRRISEIDESMKDPELRQLRRREEQLWQRALRRVNEKHYMDAQADLRQILSFRPGGVHRDDAQRYLDKVIPQQTQERDILTEADLDLNQRDFQAARWEAEKLTKLGGDATELLVQIDRAEQSQFAQLQSQFNEFKQRGDDAAVQGLNALWPKFQALAVAGGPRSGDAVDYMNEIPSVMSEIQARMEAKNADAVFQRMVQRYRRAVDSQDENSLAAARTDFESVVKGRGPHADEAQNYLSDVKSKLEAVGKPSVAAAKPSAKPETPEDAVQAAIRRYAQAFELRDTDALRQVWPNLGGQYEGYKDWFEKASSIRMRLNLESTTMGAGGATAIVKAQASREYTAAGSKTKSSKYSAIFHLAKLNGAWVIEEVELGPES
jgi:hypothetical protein